jgi:hypothetical protein
MIDPAGNNTDDKLGYRGAVISADNRHIVACSYQYNAWQGKCMVFSESNLGDQDWNNNQVNLLDPTGVAGDKLGERGAVISTDSRHIVACSHRWNSNQGRCIVFSESNLGDQDWDNNHVKLR